MKLRLLIDTSVWLDLAKDYRQLPIIDALTYIWEANELELILPRWSWRNGIATKDRVIAESRQSLSSHFKRVRDAVVQFAPEGERDTTLKQLHEVDHKIAVGGEAINDAVEQIEKLFADAKTIEPTTPSRRGRPTERLRSSRRFTGSGTASAMLFSLRLTSTLWPLARTTRTCMPLSLITCSTSATETRDSHTQTLLRYSMALA